MDNYEVYRRQYAQLNEFEKEVLLSIGSGLWIEVFEKLRGVTFDCEGKKIVLRCYVDGNIDDDDQESLECMLTQVISYFPEDHHVDLEVIRVDAPAPIQAQKAWVYLRKEKSN